MVLQFHLTRFSDVIIRNWKMQYLIIIYVIHCLKYRNFISGKLGEISVFYAASVLHLWNIANEIYALYLV